MKHENATSADNAQVAATIRHTLTFEEVYAMTYVRESIECLLDQNLRQYPVLNGYKDDLRQEILIRLNDELPVFDPEKSSFNTFFRRVLHAAMYDARKVYFRNQNLTLRFAAELEDFESDDTDSIPAESLAIFQKYSGRRNVKTGCSRDHSNLFSGTSKSRECTSCRVQHPLSGETTSNDGTSLPSYVYPTSPKSI